MKKGLYILMIAMVPVLAQGQLKGLMDRANSKVENRINNKVDQSMDKALDRAEGKPGVGGATATSEEPQTEVPHRQKRDRQLLEV